MPDSVMHLRLIAKTAMRSRVLDTRVRYVPTFRGSHAGTKQTGRTMYGTRASPSPSATATSACPLRPRDALGRVQLGAGGRVKRGGNVREVTR
eukprot:3595072-Rhodomonas_salina.1